MRITLLLFLLTTLLAGHAMETGNSVVELHDNASVFNSYFINNTQLNKLQFIYPVTSGSLATSKKSALQSNWDVFKQRLINPVTIREVVNIERLKDLEDIWLSNCQKEQFCENPYSFKNGNNLLLLALFILNESNYKKSLEVFARNKNIFFNNTELPDNQLIDTLPKKRTSSCALQ